MVEQSITAPRVDANSDRLMFTMNKQSGHSVKRGEIIAIVETSKTALEVEAPDTGVLTWLVLDDQEVEVGQHLGVVRVTDAKNSTETVLNPAEQLTKNIGINQQFTAPATKLIDEYRINPELFDGVSLVTTNIVKTFIERLNNKNDVTALAKAHFGQTKYLHPLIDGYHEPPTAKFRWSEKTPTSVRIPSSIDILEMLHIRAIINLPGVMSAAIVVRTEDGRLIISGAKATPPLEDEESDYKREVMHALASEKEATQADLVISVLSHPTMEFSHTALLWPKSKITVAVAINEKAQKIVFDATYDHRFLNGYLMMKFAEESVDI